MNIFQIRAKQTYQVLPIYYNLIRETGESTSIHSINDNNYCGRGGKAKTRDKNPRSTSGAVGGRIPISSNFTSTSTRTCGGGNLLLTKTPYVACLSRQVNSGFRGLPGFCKGACPVRGRGQSRQVNSGFRGLLRFCAGGQSLEPAPPGAAGNQYRSIPVSWGLPPQWGQSPEPGAAGKRIGLFIKNPRRGR